MTNEEAFQEVIGSLMKSIPENQLPNEQPISKSFLEATTAEKLDYTKIINENEELTNKYKYLVKGYGFESFYDLYYFADSCDSIQEVLIKGGQKDLSKLKKVKRKVVRNGKPMVATIYEDGGSGDDGKNPMDKGAGAQERPQPRHASELSMSFLGDDEVGADPKKVAKLAKGAANLDGEFDTDCGSFMLLQDETGALGGVAGFKQEGKYLKLVFTQSDNLTSGVSYVAFYQLLLRAWRNNLGAMLDVTDDATAKELFKEYGLTKSGNSYKISANSLVSTLGSR